MPWIVTVEEFVFPRATRSAEHSGVTLGAATSVLLTGVKVTFGVMRYKNGGGSICARVSGSALRWERRPTELTDLNGSRSDIGVWGGSSAKK